MPVVGIQIKPVGNNCNIACKYCYARPFIKKYKVMPFDTLDILFQKVCAYQKEVVITWHGGEPLLPGVEFYKKAFDILKKYTKDHKVKHLIQTNATLLTPEFAKFLVGNKVEIGISLDGIPECHNLNRISALGQGTFEKTLKGVSLLRENGYNPSLICTVTKDTLEYAVENFDFFIKNGFKRIKYSPVYDSATDSFSINNKEWFEYLNKIFHRWLEYDDEEISVRELDEVIAWFSEKPLNLCSSQNICLSWASIDPDGELYPCEYLRANHSYGNIKEISMDEMFKSISFKNFKEMFTATPTSCQKCAFYRFCGNGCPAIRVDEYGNPNPNGVYVYCEERKQLYNEMKTYF